MHLKLAGIITALLITLFSYSQNLLVNGSFEDENTCVEYEVKCAPEAWITNRDGFNNYFKDPNRAYDGLHSLAIEAGYSYKSFQRTFIRSKLLCGLRKGNRYRLEFYVKSPHAILDSMGVLFTTFDFLFSKTRLQHQSPTMFLRAHSGAFTRDSNWQRVSMDYTATGLESFITIANFSRRDINRETGIRLEKHFFVFVDAISLVPLNRHEQLCEGWQALKQQIYDQDERHEFLRQSVRRHNDNPPIVKLPATSIAIVDTMTLPDMLFASGKATLQKTSSGLLDQFCQGIAGKRIDSIVIEGHTDNVGSYASNLRLSAERASTVEVSIRQRLIQKNPQVITRGWADLRPVASNNSAEGKQRNRRVEIIVYARE